MIEKAPGGLLQKPARSSSGLRERFTPLAGPAGKSSLLSGRASPRGSLPGRRTWLKTK